MYFLHQFTKYLALLHMSNDSRPIFIDNFNDIFRWSYNQTILDFLDPCISIHLYKDGEYQNINVSSSLVLLFLYINQSM